MGILISAGTFETCYDYNPPKLGANPTDDEKQKWEEKYPHGVAAWDPKTYLAELAPRY